MALVLDSFPISCAQTCLVWFPPSVAGFILKGLRCTSFLWQGLSSPG